MCSRYYFVSLLLLSLLPALLWGQYHRVYFTDKGGQDALLDTPEKLLSPRSLARRQRMDIPLGPSDLPVAPAYLSALEALDLEVAFPVFIDDHDHHHDDTGEECKDEK